MTGNISNLDRLGASRLRSVEALALISCHVPASARDRFAALLRARGLTMAAGLRAYVMGMVGAQPAEPPRGGAAHKLSLRLRGRARVRLIEEAKARGTTPAAWATAMLEAQLCREERWAGDELAVLRGIHRAVLGMPPGESVTTLLAALERTMAANRAYWGVEPLQAELRRRL